MKPYSRDLRIRIVSAYENGEGSMRQLSVRFQVSLSFVRDLIHRYRATGDVIPKPHGGGSPAKLTASDLEAVRALVQAAPDASLEDLCNDLYAARQVMISQATMSRTLAKLELSRQSNPRGRRQRSL